MRGRSDKTFAITLFQMNHLKEYVKKKGSTWRPSALCSILLCIPFKAWRPKVCKYFKVFNRINFTQTEKAQPSTSPFTATISARQGSLSPTTALPTANTDFWKKLWIHLPLIFLLWCNEPVGSWWEYVPHKACWFHKSHRWLTHPQPQLKRDGQLEEQITWTACLTFPASSSSCTLLF